MFVGIFICTRRACRKHVGICDKAAKIHQAALEEKIAEFVRNTLDFKEQNVSWTTMSHMNLVCKVGI